MASDDEVETVSEDTEREDLRQMIREELSSVIGDLRRTETEPEPVVEEDPAPSETSSMSVRDIEAAAERAVRRAMLELSAKAPPKKAAPKKAAEPEPTPVDPPKTWLDKMRDKAWS